jgi:lipoate-protein ligase A
MAIDEALLRCFDPRASLPILRLYRWEPPALSLGRFQEVRRVLDLDRCRAHALPMVRRITGGGALYHAEELTYSLICTSTQIPPATSIRDSFRVLTGFLIGFYARLGLHAAYARDVTQGATRLGTRTPFCFAGREEFDILIHGQKIGGNAQRRQRRLIFQHGSIPQSCQVETGLSYMADRFPGYARGVTSLAECGVRAEPDRLSEELVAAFRDSFGVECCEERLSQEEERCAQELILRKYSTTAWNMEGVER